MSPGQPDWAAIYLAHRTTMFKVAAALLRGAGLASHAQDVVQAAMESVLASPPSQPVRSWEGFLVTAVQRRALDLIGSAAVRHAGPELDESQHDGSGSPDVAQDLAQDVAERVDEQRRAALAWDCLSILDERRRQVVWKTAALEQPAKDAAAELGISVSRVSQLRSQALKLLLDEMNRREGR